jgi:hypothetical protein
MPHQANTQIPQSAPLQLIHRLRQLHQGMRTIFRSRNRPRMRQIRGQLPTRHEPPRRHCHGTDLGSSRTQSNSSGQSRRQCNSIGTILPAPNLTYRRHPGQQGRRHSHDQEPDPSAQRKSSGHQRPFSHSPQGISCVYFCASLCSNHGWLTGTVLEGYWSAGCNHNHQIQLSTRIPSFRLLSL